MFTHDNKEMNRQTCLDQIKLMKDYGRKIIQGKYDDGAWLRKTQNMQDVRQTIGAIKENDRTQEQIEQLFVVNQIIDRKDYLVGVINQIEVEMLLLETISDIESFDYEQRFAELTQ